MSDVFAMRDEMRRLEHEFVDLAARYIQLGWECEGIACIMDDVASMVPECDTGEDARDVVPDSRDMD